jgi:hypothetical protein
MRHRRAKNPRICEASELHCSPLTLVGASVLLPLCDVCPRGVTLRRTGESALFRAVKNGRRDLVKKHLAIGVGLLCLHVCRACVGVCVRVWVFVCVRVRVRGCGCVRGGNAPSVMTVTLPSLLLMLVAQTM